MRGDLAVTPAIFNVPIAVDGGRYTVAAVAEGREPFTATFEIDAAGASHQVELRLPAADKTVTPAARPRVARPEQATPTTMPPIRIAGIVVGSVGLTLAGVGIGIGVTGLDHSNEAAASFEAAQNEQQAAAARDDHTSAGNLITAGWAMTGLGAAAAVAGIVLIAVAPDDAQPKTAVPSIRIRATAGGLSATGTW